MPGIWDPLTFITVLILVFSFFLLLAGAFTAYFGSGKSRKVGGGLLGGGIALGVLWVVLASKNLGLGSFNVDVLPIVIEAFGYLLAATIGAAAAIGLFLLAIMKS